MVLSKIINLSTPGWLYTVGPKVGTIYVLGSRRKDLRGVGSEIRGPGCEDVSILTRALGMQRGVYGIGFAGPFTGP